jgi:hypothetical protein
MRYYSIYYITLCVALFASCSKEDDNNTVVFPTDRTIIVYMAANNDLSDDAWDNISEMQSGYGEKGANLIVFIAPEDDTPHILRIGRESNIRVKNYPVDFNAMDAAQMREVLNDITGMYPAASYGLVLWSHGTSWLPAGRQLKSFGEDNGRQMNIAALVAALPVRFDFILMDACLMGSVEVAYELRNKANFILASPAEIIYTGFPYMQIIPELIQPEINLRKVAESYFNFYDKMPGAYRSATISLINTGELERLALVTAQLTADRAFDAVIFDRSSVQRLDVYEEHYTFDFLDFIEKAFPNADINPLKEQLSKTVLYKANTPRFIDEYDIRTCCGLSCYILHPQRDDLNEYYQQLDWCQTSGFYRLFSNEAQETSDGPVNDNRTSDEPQNDETRQDETPEAQPHGAALPP